ncbi:MAG: hypothetical protein LUI87_04935 [Lachnospiraceae bacterium]|nr:hypothetical protein [Lachnospiraceae bacterium]
MAELKKRNSMADTLRGMAQTDPRTVDRETLVDIRDVKIHTELSDRERMLDFIQQIKNPYCYLDNGVVVKISFEGTRSMEESISHYIRTMEG